MALQTKKGNQHMLRWCTILIGTFLPQRCISGFAAGDGTDESAEADY